LRGLSTGQYNDPMRVVAFNTREGWSRDVSYEFAVELQRRADINGHELTGTLGDFVEFTSIFARARCITCTSKIVFEHFIH
jgi:hypothetical protein